LGVGALVGASVRGKKVDDCSRPTGILPQVKGIVRKPGKTNYRNNVPEWPQWKRTEKDRKSSKGDTGDECTSRKSHADEGLVQTLADGELLVNDNANRCIIRALKEQEKVTRE